VSSKLKEDFQAWTVLSNSRFQNLKSPKAVTIYFMLYEELTSKEGLKFCAGSAISGHWGHHL